MHAAERARLMNIGKSPPFVDGQIASIAATQNLTLVTFNIGNFANFHGLNVVSWKK